MNTKIRSKLTEKIRQIQVFPINNNSLQNTHKIINVFLMTYPKAILIYVSDEKIIYEYNKNILEGGII
jgi:hypothetical protein